MNTCVTHRVVTIYISFIYGGQYLSTSELLSRGLRPLFSDEEGFPQAAEGYLRETAV